MMELNLRRFLGNVWMLIILMETGCVNFLIEEMHFIYISELSRFICYSVINFFIK